MAITDYFTISYIFFGRQTYGAAEESDAENANAMRRHGAIFHLCGIVL